MKWFRCNKRETKSIFQLAKIYRSLEVYIHVRALVILRGTCSPKMERIIESDYRYTTRGKHIIGTMEYTGRFGGVI